MLGQPATQSAESGKSSSGGKLAQLRASYGLSQSSLGEVDPVSSSLQLATFGMRPIAIIVLWHKATKYQEMEDFDNVTATVNQIAKLQPHFTSIWKFQAHNLAYNISVEFDDYFVITPNSEYLSWDKEKFLKESNLTIGKYCDDDFNYNSETNPHFLTVKEIRDLIIKNVPGGEDINA